MNFFKQNGSVKKIQIHSLKWDDVIDDIDDQNYERNCIQWVWKTVIVRMIFAHKMNQLFFDLLAKSQIVSIQAKLII